MFTFHPECNHVLVSLNSCVKVWLRLWFVVENQTLGCYLFGGLNFRIYIFIQISARIDQMNNR